MDDSVSIIPSKDVFTRYELGEINRDMQAKKEARLQRRIKK
jgi:hypothetical protein